MRLNLTPRMREIVALAARGLTGPEIAVELGISYQTVRTLKGDALRRLGVHTMAHAVALTLRQP